MKVTTNRDTQKFQPITLNIVIETQEEFGAFLELNYSSTFFPELLLNNSSITSPERDSLVELMGSIYVNLRGYCGAN